MGWVLVQSMIYAHCGVHVSGKTNTFFRVCWVSQSFSRKKPSSSASLHSALGQNSLKTKDE